MQHVMQSLPRVGELYVARARSDGGVVAAELADGRAVHSVASRHDADALRIRRPHVHSGLGRLLLCGHMEAWRLCARRFPRRHQLHGRMRGHGATGTSGRDRVWCLGWL